MPIENDGQNDNTAANNPKGQNEGPTQPDTIDLLTEPTKCSLLDGSGCDMELAFATVYPDQETCHTVSVEYGYVVVQPTYVWANGRHIKLPISVRDEITTLGDSLLQRIQRPRLRNRYTTQVESTHLCSHISWYSFRWSYYSSASAKAALAEASTQPAA